MLRRSQNMERRKIAETAVAGTTPIRQSVAVQRTSRSSPTLTTVWNFWQDLSTVFIPIG